MLRHWSVGIPALTIHRGRTDLRAPRTQTLISLGAALLLVGTVFVAVSAIGPASLCGNCHAMRPYAQAYAESVHSGAGCVVCHAPTLPDRIGMGGRVLSGMVPSAITGARSVTGPAQGLGDDGCRSCHAQDIRGQVRGGSITLLHGVCAQDAACVSCHGNVAHEDVTRVPRAYAMESCIACHRQEVATIECDGCHSARTQQERLRGGSWQVTHGPQIIQTHGLGDISSCGICHSPDHCVGCHGTALPHPIGFGQAHGEEALRDPAVCEACHETGALCAPCHGIEMPHPAGFLGVHSSIASGVDDPACTRCHDVRQCATCHERHDDHPRGPGSPPKAGG